jgi:hypothetical protein
LIRDPKQLQHKRVLFVAQSDRRGSDALHGRGPFSGRECGDSNLAPNDLSKYRGQSFDYVISLCEIVVQCASFEKLRRLDR